MVSGLQVLGEMLSTPDIAAWDNLTPVRNWLESVEEENLRLPPPGSIVRVCSPDVIQRTFNAAIRVDIRRVDLSKTCLSQAFLCPMFSAKRVCTRFNTGSITAHYTNVECPATVKDLADLKRKYGFSFNEIGILSLKDAKAFWKELQPVLLTCTLTCTAAVDNDILYVYKSPEVPMYNITYKHLKEQAQ